MTDSGGPGTAISPGVENLLRILAATAPQSEYERLERAREEGSLKYAELKVVVADHVVAVVEPMRERRATLTPAYARDVLEQGAAHARGIARSTLAEARDRIGILRVARSEPS